MPAPVLLCSLNVLTSKLDCYLQSDTFYTHLSLRKSFLIGVGGKSLTPKTTKGYGERVKTEKPAESSAPDDLRASEYYPSQNFPLPKGTNIETTADIKPKNLRLAYFALKYGSGVQKVTFIPLGAGFCPDRRAKSVQSSSQGIQGPESPLPKEQDILAGKRARRSACSWCQ